MSDNKRHSIKYYYGNELTKLKLVNPNELVEGLIRQPSLNILFGESGCGKSLLSMNLMFAMASGSNKFLDYKIIHCGKVLFLNNEIPLSEFIERFRLMEKGIENRDSVLKNIVIPEYVPPIEEYEVELSTKIEEEKIKLVVLDCLYWAHDKKENDNTEIKSLVRKLVKLRNEHSVSILVIHHDKKGSKNFSMHTDNMRGASVLANAADAVFELRRSGTDPSLRLFKPTKLRYSADKYSNARLLNLDPLTLSFTDLGNADETEHIVTNVNDAKSKKRDFYEFIQPSEILSRSEIIQRCKPWGVSDRTIDRDLELAIKTGTITSPETGLYCF